MEEKESKINATQNAESESLFRKKYLTKASDLFAALDTMERRWSGQQIKHYSAEYQKRVTQMIGEFRQVLKRHALFDCPSGLWAYSIVIRGRGIFLYLEHYQKASAIRVRKREYFTKDESYELVCMKARLLNAEDYANLHGISHVAAVTRIRRGKIRSAVKVGKQWRIPELAEPIERGYQATDYTWRGRLSGLPEQFRIIENYKKAEFFQDDKDLTLFHVRFTGDAEDPMEFTCSRNQRGRIEQVLIGHPDVICMSDVIDCMDKKG